MLLVTIKFDSFLGTVLFRIFKNKKRGYDYEIIGDCEGIDELEPYAVQKIDNLVGVLNMGQMTEYKLINAAHVVERSLKNSPNNNPMMENAPNLGASALGINNTVQGDLPLVRFKLEEETTITTFKFPFSEEMVELVKTFFGSKDPLLSHIAKVVGEDAIDVRGNIIIDNPNITVVCWLGEVTSNDNTMGFILKNKI